MIEVLLFLAIILGCIIGFILVVQFLGGLVALAIFLVASFKQHRRQAKVRRQRQRK